MEQEKQRIYTIVVVIALVALLFSCVAGAAAGGLAGFLVGQRAARQVLVAERRDLGREAPFITPVPVPERPSTRIEGALVLEVLAGTPADRAGLQPGDILVAVDGTPIDRFHQLPDILADYRPGDRVTIELWRAGDQRAVQATLDEHPEDPGRAYLGIRFQMNLQPNMDLPGG